MLNWNAMRASSPSWLSPFADGTPGFRINVEEAIRLNKAAIGSKTSGFTPEELAACAAFQDSAGTLPVTAMEQPLGLILDTKLGVPVLGPELVTNGAFSDGATGWTLGAGWTVASGSASHSSAAGVGEIKTADPILTEGRWYVAEFVRLDDTGSVINAVFGKSYVGVSARAGRRRVIGRASGASTFGLQGGGTYQVANISVREIPGNHFVQPSNTASRPIVSRRVNLLTATETLATQNVMTLAASHVLTFSGTGSVTLSGTATGTYSAGTHTITTTAGTLTVTVSGSVTDADLRLAIDANLPPYQRVTSSTDYDEVGFPAYARFDGLDDWLETGGTVDMTSTDEVTVIAGVTKLSGMQGMILEFSTNAIDTDGAFNLRSSPVDNPSYLQAASRGTQSVVINYTKTNPPIKMVVSVRADISSKVLSLRRNGVQAAGTPADQGTGNYGAHKFYMGRRSDTTLPFNGRVYGITVIGKLLTDSQLAAAEQAEQNLGRLY